MGLVKMVALFFLTLMMILVLTTFITLCFIGLYQGLLWFFCVILKPSNEAVKQDENDRER